MKHSIKLPQYKYLVKQDTLLFMEGWINFAYNKLYNTCVELGDFKYKLMVFRDGSSENHHIIDTFKKIAGKQTFYYDKKENIKIEFMNRECTAITLSYTEVPNMTHEQMLNMFYDAEDIHHFSSFDPCVKSIIYGFDTHKLESLYIKGSNLLAIQSIIEDNDLEDNCIELDEYKLKEDKSNIEITYQIIYVGTRYVGQVDFTKLHESELPFFYEWLKHNFNSSFVAQLKHQESILHQVM